jgi:hypothetical protein
MSPKDNKKPAPAGFLLLSTNILERPVNWVALFVFGIVLYFGKTVTATATVAILLMGQRCIT